MSPFAYRAAVLFCAAVIYVAGKTAGMDQAERLFVKGAEFGRGTSNP